MHTIGLILIGVLAGIFGGLFGVGGGTVMIPALVFCYGLSQHQAQGLSLAAMLPPVTFLAVYAYWKEGHVHIPTAGWIALGLILGAALGGIWVQPIQDSILRKLFAVFLMAVAARMFFK